MQEHLNLVYSAALREMHGDGALAEDVSQAVFTELARKAPRLLGHPALAGWLYTTVRQVAANSRRAEQHRRRREEEAQRTNELLSGDSPNEIWQRIRPVLDDALHELKEADREAVVLRYLEDRALREVSARLGLTENAARMRVDRALEKLRGVLARRGVTSTASGLVAALAIGVPTPAPAALAATIAGTALASGAAAGSTTLTSLKIMSLFRVKSALLGTLVVTAIAVPVWQQTRLQRVRSENAQLRAQLARQASEADTNPISGAMGDAVKRSLEQQAKGQVSRMAASLHLTPEQAQAAREILLRRAQAMSGGMQQVFSGKFDKEELLRFRQDAGDPEKEIQALLTQDQKAAYPSFQPEAAAYNARRAANAELFQLQSTLGLTPEQEDRALAALYDVSYHQLIGSPTPTFADEAEAMQWSLDQKTKALEAVLTPAQFENYCRQQATASKLIKDILSRMRGEGGSD